MIDQIDVVTVLSRQRPLFHSEADFQHAFAWEIQRRLPNANIRLERPILRNGKWLHLDLLVSDSDRSIAIELKYKTRELSLNHQGENYHVKNHSAQDVGRYDFLKDIYRLELITKSIDNCCGWAVLLTNDFAYWRPARGGTNDDAFRIHEGQVIGGSLSWSENAAPGSIKGREAVIQFDSEYTMNWHDYSVVEGSKAGTFRYLPIRIPSR